MVPAELSHSVSQGIGMRNNQHTSRSGSQNTHPSSPKQAVLSEQTTEDFVFRSRVQPAEDVVKHEKLLPRIYSSGYGLHQRVSHDQRAHVA